MRHLLLRQPRRRERFCWTRRWDGERIVYRLFRRGHDGRISSTQECFAMTEDRSVIAKRLNNSRHKLRDYVDEIDLYAMGVTNG